MKKIIAAAIANISGLIIAVAGIILNVLGSAAEEDFGTALIIIGAIVWTIGLVFFALFQENKRDN